MTTPAPAPVSPNAPSPQVTLRRLFLTLFLRGRSSRGLNRKTAPKSVGQKLTLILFYYFAFGAFSLAFSHQTVFALSAYLHAMTFVFLGMFVASSAGEVLFNKEEADILLHRPVDPRALLWAKVRMLVEVSLWMSCAFNLVGFYVGTRTTDGSWLFIPVHAVSMVLESVFCVGCVVMMYQLCLRFFGRERLESLMTSTQVLVAIAAVMSGQILPQLVIDVHHTFKLSASTWWIALIPPAWFAGLDDVVAGSRATGSWILAGLALLVTAAVLTAAFGKLSRDYELGLQTMNESAPRPRRSRGRRRLLDVLIDLPPFSWWLRNPVERAAFLLSAAYLMRDRDVKLRVYPAIAPFLALPLVFIFRSREHNMGQLDGFELGMVSTYLAIIPLMAVNVLQYSQQWQACDIFRSAPIPGPGPLCHGGRRAVLLLLAAPMCLLILLILSVMHHGLSNAILMIPGLISLPVFAMAANIGGAAVPLSRPTEEAKSASRGLTVMLAMFCSGLLSALTIFASSEGWFWWLVGIESIVVIALYLLIRRAVTTAAWQPIE